MFNRCSHSPNEEADKILARANEAFYGTTVNGYISELNKAVCDMYRVATRSRADKVKYGNLYRFK